MVMKYLFLLITIFAHFITFGQNDSDSKKEVIVPSEVKFAFEKEFPNQIAFWQTEYRGDEADQLTYETSVLFEKRFAVVFFDKMGNLKAVEVEIHLRELPEETLNYLEKNYPNQKTIKAVKVYKNKKTEISYEVGIQDQGKFADLVFDSTGYFLTRVEKTN